MAPRINAWAPTQKTQAIPTHPGEARTQGGLPRIHPGSAVKVIDSVCLVTFFVAVVPKVSGIPQGIFHPKMEPPPDENPGLYVIHRGFSWPNKGSIDQRISITPLRSMKNGRSDRSSPRKLARPLLNWCGVLLPVMRPQKCRIFRIKNPYRYLV